MTKEELAAKVEWEGGLAEAVFGYGLTRADMPEDAPTWVWANWQCLMDAKGALRRIEEWLDEDGEGGVSEPAGDSPGGPPAGESRLPGGSDDYLPSENRPDDSAGIGHVTLLEKISGIPSNGILVYDMVLPEWAQPVMVKPLRNALAGSRADEGSTN